MLTRTGNLSLGRLACLMLQADDSSSLYFQTI